ncbi:MAG: PssD/Cps14F family polysaccharide biosynthesis glycosyltransferase [Bacilli bacterium]|nr:PssD/Cps14F family polysaccharide biosynthesis glycosyltransferase [Bacilli bacterium]
MKKVLFIASTGGHLNELMQLKDMFNYYDYHIVTEKTNSNKYLKKEYGKKINYLIYGTKHHMLTYPFKLLINCFISLFIYLKFRPDYIITTGTHTAGPMCLIGKIFGSRVIYIETFANMVTKTATGKLIYPIADKFIVQWKSMKKLYPDSEFGGWIF